VADVLTQWPEWRLCADRPIVIAPWGTEYRLASTREEAVRVARATEAAMLELSPDAKYAELRATYTLTEFRRLMFRVVRERGEDERVVGGAMAQLLDALLWQLTWDDVTEVQA
jgi:hypothetical protein